MCKVNRFLKMLVVSITLCCVSGVQLFGADLSTQAWAALMQNKLNVIEEQYKGG